MKNWTELYTPLSLIIHEQKNLLILNKPAGVPAQEDRTGDMSMLAWVESNVGSKLHIVNRLDRPVSGIMICSSRAAPLSQSVEVNKSYLAITNKVKIDQARLDHYISKNGRLKKAFISDTPRDNYKNCSLDYTLLRHLDKYDLLQIKAYTGRFHQIRAQLAHIDSPIKGDVKYGARRSNKDRSIHLHAHHVSIPKLGIDISARPLHEENLWLKALEDISL